MYSRHASAFILLMLYFGNVKNSNSHVKDRADEENPSVTRLRSFLRFRTDHPNPDAGYSESIRWLQTQAEEIGLNFTVYEMEPPNLFAIVLTWDGTEPELKSVLVNSHLDVVPADASKWTYPPYAAVKDAQGRIFARGAVDMKGPLIAELEAIRRLKLGGFQSLRTIHMTVMPDEELNGVHGMQPFVKTDFFRKLNVGIDIDEAGGLDDDTKTLWISVAEKCSWKFNVTAHGIPGHGTAFPQYTSAERLNVVIKRLMEYRQAQYLKYVQSNNSGEHLSTINLVRLGGGVADNVIPGQLWASFDLRISVDPDWTFREADEMLNNILEEASLGSTNDNERVTIDFIWKSLITASTRADNSNPWWVNLQKVCREMDLTCKPLKITAGTDGRFLRDIGIPVFGISPFVTTEGVHQHNEFVVESEFLRAIDVYEKIIRSFGLEPEHAWDRKS